MMAFLFRSQFLFSVFFDVWDCTTNLLCSLLTACGCTDRPFEKKRKRGKELSVDPPRPRHTRLPPSADARMTFIRAATALAALSSSPILLANALGLTAPPQKATTAAAAAVSPSLASVPSLEAYKEGAGLLSSPWIRTDDPVVQSMLYSAPWVRSGAANSGEPLGFYPGDRVVHRRHSQVVARPDDIPA